MNLRNPVQLRCQEGNINRMQTALYTKMPGHPPTLAGSCGSVPLLAVQMGAKHAVGIDLEAYSIDAANRNPRKAGVSDKVKFLKGDI